MGTITIKNSTPVEGESLCETCMWVHMQRGFRQNEQLVFCTYDTSHRVPFKVRECTNYSDKNRPTYEQMEKLAILVEPRRLAGFQRDQREEERETAVVNE